MSLDFDSIVRIILEIELIVGYGCWAYVARVREGREGAKFTLRIFWSTPAPTRSTSPEINLKENGAKIKPLETKNTFCTFLLFVVVILVIRRRP